MATDNYTIPGVEKTVTGIDGTIKNVTVSRLTAPGENFLSLVFKIDFEVEQNGKTTTISTVGKRFPLGKSQSDFSSKSMTNEIEWYVEIVPILEKFAKAHDIPIEYFPKNMGSRFSLDPEVKQADAESILLLENLIPQGYKNEDRYIGFDLPSSKALLRMMAQYHALPLVMKFKDPQSFAVLREYLKRSVPDFEEDAKEGDEPKKPPPDYLIMYPMLQLPGCQKYKEKLEEIKDKNKFFDIFQQPGPEPWNTSIHCDFWVNNVMIKPIEGQEPLTKLVDFQFCSYATFAKDLVFFLLTSVQSEVQKKHFDYLLQYYYTEFTSILNKFKIPDLDLPYDKYLEIVKDSALNSETTHAIFFSTIVFGAKGHDNVDTLAGGVDINDHMETMINNINDVHKEKLVLIADLAAERGWL